MASAIYGNDFNSCFPLSSPGSPSASNLGLSMSIAPTLLKHDNIVSNSVNSGIVDGSKTKIFMDMISSPAIDRNSSRKVSSSDELVAATVSNSDHLEIQEGDTPAVIKIKGLSKKVAVLRRELETKSTLIESLKAQGKISGDGLASGSSWKDKVVPPGEAHSRMNLTDFPPEMDGEQVRVSPPKHVETQGSEKWKNCIVGHFVDKKFPFLSVQSIALRIGAKYGIKDVLSNEKGFFLFQFGLIDKSLRLVLGTLVVD